MRIRVPYGEKPIEEIVAGAVSSFRRREPAWPAMKRSEPWAKTSFLPGANAMDPECIIPGMSRTEADAKSMTRAGAGADILWGTKRSWEPSSEMSPGRKPGLDESSTAGDPPPRGIWNAEYCPPRRSPKKSDFPSVRKLYFAKPSHVSCIQHVTCRDGVREH